MQRYFFLHLKKEKWHTFKCFFFLNCIIYADGEKAVSFIPL